MDHHGISPNFYVVLCNASSPNSGAMSSLQRFIRSIRVVSLLNFANIFPALSLLVNSLIWLLMRYSFIAVPTSHWPSCPFNLFLFPCKLLYCCITALCIFSWKSCHKALSCLWIDVILLTGSLHCVDSPVCLFLCTIYHNKADIALPHKFIFFPIEGPWINRYKCFYWFWYLGWCRVRNCWTPPTIGPGIRIGPCV